MSQMTISEPTQSEADFMAQFDAIPPRELDRDAPPTKQSYELLKDWQARLQARGAALDAVERSQAAAFTQP